jgi:hypothetical protein
VFTNLTAEEIEIPRNTGIRPSSEGDIRFVTTEAVELPDRKGAEAEVQIEAATSGSMGNLPAGVIDAVEGPLGLQVAVINPEPTSGGTEALHAAVSVVDRMALERELTSQLIDQAEDRLIEDLPPNQILLKNSVHTTQIVERSYDREVGDPAETLALILDMEIEGAVYTRDDLETAASLVLEANLQPKYSYVPGTLIVQTDDIEASAEAGILQIRASQEIFEIIDVGRFQWNLRGKEIEDASSYIVRRLDLASDPEIHLSPNWFPRLPWIGMRINFRYPWEHVR